MKEIDHTTLIQEWKLNLGTEAQKRNLCKRKTSAE